MLSGVVRGTFVAWAFHSAQPYLLALLDDDKIWVVGAITALMSLSTILGNQVVEVFTRHCGRRSTIILGGSVVATVASVTMGLNGSFWVATVAFLAVTGSLGVISPVRHAYVHHVAPSAHRPASCPGRDLCGAGASPRRPCRVVPPDGGRGRGSTGVSYIP